MRKALIEEKGWTSEQLPHVNTIGEILNRLGFKLRRVQKTKPLKKVRETDAIFQNVLQENRASDARLDSLRISIDSKAKLDLGEFSRGGVLRAATATKALDHDTQAKKTRALRDSGCPERIADNHLRNITRNERLHR